MNKVRAVGANKRNPLEGPSRPWDNDAPHPALRCDSSISRPAMAPINPATRPSSPHGVCGPFRPLDRAFWTRIERVTALGLSSVPCGCGSRAPRTVPRTCRVGVEELPLYGENQMHPFKRTVRLSRGAPGLVQKHPFTAGRSRCFPAIKLTNRVVADQACRGRERKIYARAM